MQPNCVSSRARLCTMLFGLAALFCVTGVSAQDEPLEIGGDLFVTAEHGSVRAARDVFAVGLSIALSGTVAGDAHAVGFSVDVDADTEGDVYATGGSVSIRGSIGGDLTATGGTVRTHASAITQGNARLTGGTITVAGPVDGALVATGGEVVLNAPVSGDVWISAPRIRFGSDASVTGRLRYASVEPVDIPARVADPERVSYEKLDVGDWFTEGRDRWGWPDRPEMEIGPRVVAGAIGLSIGSFLLVGAVCLAFAPQLVSRMRKGILAQPGRMALSGLIGLSMLFGAVPILAMTLVGIPLVPIAVLAAMIVWFLSYVLGAYAIGMGISRALGMEEDPSIPQRLLVLAAVAFVAALLNFIPVIGWMANFVIVILGVGAVTHELFERLMPRSVAAVSEAS